MKKIAKWGLAFLACLTAVFIFTPIADAAETSWVPASNGKTGNLTIKPTVLDDGPSNQAWRPTDDVAGPIIDGIKYEIKQTHVYEQKLNQNSTTGEVTSLRKLNENEQHTLTDTTASGNGLTVPGLPYGRYEVKQIATSDPIYTVDPRVYVIDIPMTSPNGEETIKNVTIFPKLEKPQLTKEVDADQDNNWESEADVSSGATVKFKVETTVPWMTDKDENSVVTEILISDSYQYDEGYVVVGEPKALNQVQNLVVQVNGALHQGLTDLVEKSSDSDKGGFTLHIEDIARYKLSGGDRITIEYELKLSRIGKLINTAGVEFKFEGGSIIPPEVKVPVKVGGHSLTIIKVDATTGEKLKDAEFKLLKITEDEADPDRELIDTKTTPDSGQVTFEQLEAGVYELEETKAPDGYNLLTEPIRIEIHENQNIELTVKNIKKGDIPNTGGYGTLAFTVVGLAVMAGATYVLTKKDDKTTTVEESASNDLSE